MTLHSAQYPIPAWTKESDLRPQNEMSGFSLDLAVAYDRLGPVFLKAIGKLARQGFVLPFADCQDLIHDFILEERESVASNFDPEKGSFEGYIYGAFVHFARPRIVKLQRFKDSLVDPRELENIQIGTEEHEENLHDRQLVSEAIKSLPCVPQEVLRRFMYSEIASERTLAKEFSLSRYRLREILIQALGALVIFMEERGQIREQDWEVAKALWRDGRTVHETAMLYGMTLQQVRTANARNCRVITQALSRYQLSRKRRSAMSNEENRLSAQALLERALTSPGDKSLVQQISERGAELIEALQAMELSGVPDEDLDKVDPMWVAEIYETLSKATKGAFDTELVDARAAKALFEATERDEASVGLAFKETLLPGLPLTCLDFRSWFANAPLVAVEEAERGQNVPDVRASWPISIQLVVYGVTPLTVFYVSGLLDRLVGDGMLPSDSVRLGEEMDESIVDEAGNTFSLRAVVLDEISKVANCREATAISLYSWLCRVAQYKGFLFGGFRAEPRQYGIELFRTSEHFKNLYERWGRAVEPVREYECV
jgi:RNA polymerase sigma factor (sigma-70 family)